MTAISARVRGRRNASGKTNGQRTRERAHIGDVNGASAQAEGLWLCVESATASSPAAAVSEGLWSVLRPAAAAPATLAAPDGREQQRTGSLFDESWELAQLEDRRQLRAI